MKVLFTILLAFFCFLATVSKAQDNLLDSLQRELLLASHDTVRCSLLAQLAEKAPDGEWENYNNQLRKIAEQNISRHPEKVLKQTYQKYLANAYNNMGFLANQQGEIEKALSYHNKSITLANEIGDKKNIAYYQINIGSIYERMGDIKKALNCYSQSLQMGEESGDKEAIAYALNNIGTIYHDQGDLSKALDHFIKSSGIHEQIQDQSGLAQSLNNIGLVYFEKGNTAKALEYYNKSLLIREKANDLNGVANSYNNIGKIYNDAGDLIKALEFYNESLSLREQTKNKYGVASSLNNIGGIYFKLATVSNNKSERKKHLNRALKSCLQSLQLSRELGYPENIRNAAGHLRKIYRELNDPVKALEMYELYVHMRDSINNEKTLKAAKGQQFRYEWEKHESALKAEQEIKDAVTEKERQQQRLLIYFVVTGLGSVILFSLFLLSRFRLTRRQKIIIEKQKEIVVNAYSQLHEKNKEVIDSIRYAKRIQQALLTSEKYIGRNINRLIK